MSLLTPSFGKSGSAALAQIIRNRGTRFIEFARACNPEIGVLEAEIATIEARLGTDFERSDDFSTCNAIAHRLASLYCIGALAEVFTPDSLQIRRIIEARGKHRPTSAPALPSPEVHFFPCASRETMEAACA